MYYTDHLLDIFHDLRLSLVTGKPGIKISDNIHADLTSQGIARGGGGRGGNEEAVEEEDDLTIYSY